MKVIGFHIGDPLLQREQVRLRTPLEDYYFFRYAREYGITAFASKLVCEAAKVRGGSYHQTELSPDQLKTITTHLDLYSRYK